MSYLKIAMDIIFATLVIISFFCNTFQYLSILTVHLTTIEYNMDQSRSIISIITSADCNDYAKYGIYFCREAEQWMRSGLIYIIMSSFALFFVLLDILSSCNSLF